VIISLEILQLGWSIGKNRQENVLDIVMLLVAMNLVAKVSLGLMLNVAIFLIEHGI